MNNKATSRLHADTPRLITDPERVNHFYHIERTSIRSFVAMLNRIFSTMENALLASANTAPNQNLQRSYFTDIDEIQSKSVHSQTRFRHYLTQNFRLLFNDQSQRRAPSLIDLYGAQSFDIEASINNIITRARCELPGPLLHILTRLNALLPEAKIASSNNPLDPQQIVCAFALAIAPLKLSNSNQLKLLSIFAQTLTATLRQEISDTNNYLIDKGFCVEIDAASIRHTRFTTAAKKTSQTNEVAGTQVHEIIQPTGKTPPAQIQQRYLPAPKLIQIIDYLQRIQSKHPLSIGPLRIHPLVEFLLQNSAATHERRSLPSRDKEIILLLDRAFSFIYTQELPIALRSLLLQLQLPLLKVALVDTRFLKNRHHPFRKLLNAITSLESQSDLALQRPLYNGIRNIIDHLTHELYRTPAQLQKQVKSLLNIAKQHSQRAKIIEQRLIQSEQGKDKTTYARTITDQLLSDRLQGKSIHPKCTTFLLGPWKQILFQHYLKFDDHSAEVAHVLSLTQHIISLSGGPTSTPPHTLDQLIESIREKLRLITTDTQQVSKHLTQFRLALHRVHTDASIGQANYPRIDNILKEPSTMVDYMDQQEVEKLDAALFCDTHTQVEHLSLGTWFRFMATDSTPVLCKLSQRLPFSQDLLFSLPSGQKSSILSTTEVATRMVKKEIIPTQHGPLMDQALRHANHSLRSKKARE